MCQDLPDGSAELYHQARRYVSDSRYASWTDGDAVVHEHQPGRNNQPGQGRISRSARRLTGVGRRGLDAEFFPIVRELVR